VKKLTNLFLTVLTASTFLTSVKAADEEVYTERYTRTTTTYEEDTTAVEGTGNCGDTFLRPINVQNAYIDTECKNELRVSFDWFRAHQDLGGGNATRSSSYNLPRVEYRRSFDTAIPTRLGLSTSLNAGSGETEIGGFEDEDSAFGFGNLGITAEAAFLNDEDFALTGYFNQHIPWVHSDRLLANTLRPINGTNAYSFQTGLQYQFNVIGEALRWFGDVGYRFDNLDAAPIVHSFVYYNELVQQTGTPLNLSLGLLGITTYDDTFGGTDLRLVPGLIVPLGEDQQTQLRLGFPIGISGFAPDFGVQASVFALI
jgi:hypothetical protein